MMALGSIFYLIIFGLSILFLLRRFTRRRDTNTDALDADLLSGSTGRNSVTGAEQFKKRPEAFDAAKEKLLRRTIFICVVIFPSIMLLNYVQSDTGTFDLTTWGISLAFFIGIMIFSFSNNVKKLKAIYDSYLLSIDKEFISWKRNDMRLSAIPVSEITAIIKKKNGNILVRGKSAFNIIIVPAPEVEDRERLEKLLSDIKPFSAKMPTLAERVLPAFYFVRTMPKK